MKKQHSFREFRSVFLWALLATAVLVPFERGAAEESSSQAGFLRPDFENPLIDGENPAEWSSVTLFNGHVGTQHTTSGGAIKLSQSSFGQPVARNLPYPGFVGAALDEAWCRLYSDYVPEDPALRDLYKSEDAAFRYKVDLYARDVDAQQYIRAQFENMSSYWTYAESGRAQEAAGVLRQALKVAPWDRDLRWSLLDIYYDTAVADLALAKEKMVEAYQASLGLVAPPPGEFLISEEIKLFEEALELYRNAKQRYFELLNDPLSVNVNDLYPEAPDGVPFGYYLFQEGVPLRSLMSSLRKDADGNLVLHTDEAYDDADPVLPFDGYKDLVLLFDIERDTARTAAQLARRYILRGDPGTTEDPRSDFEKALDLIADIQQTSFVEGSVLLGIYPGCTDEADGDSGLRESVASWRHALTELSSYKTYAENQTNLLGFTDDFLVLPQSQIPGDPQSEYFDSYNFFNAYLMDEVSGPLKIALDELETAKAEYTNYRDRQDQLAVQFERLNANYDKRLLEIVGAYPGDLKYDDPYGNEGSEMWVQHKNIEIALNHVQANRQEIDNLIEQVNIEIERRGQEKNINNAIGQVYLTCGEKQAKLTEAIGYINAAQAAADNLAAAAASVSVKCGVPLEWGSVTVSGGLVAYTANAVFQAGMEVAKGFAQAGKEKLAAAEKGAVHSLNDALLDVNSKTQIKTWLLRMNTLAIESSEAALILEQEIGRLTGLQSEKEALERRKAEVNETLAERYFADPSHRLLMESSVQRAQLAFERSQKWMFFAVRALEYKWNQKFEHPDYLGRAHSSKALSKLRNAEELQDMYNAMDDWNQNRSIGSKNDDGYKRFSFRQDFLGYRDGSLYPDPISGKMVQPVAAFRSYLSQDSLYLEPDDPENPLPDYKALRLTFSTAFQPESGGFFLRSRWLEKIMFMRVKAFGGAIGGIESTRDGYLRYGGTSLIRNQTPGTPDPERPDRIKDEATAYATQYWYYDGQLNKWQSKDAFGSYVSVQVSNDPDVPPSVYEINVFKERSVAASEWTFYLAVESPGGLPLVDVSNLEDIEVHFYFYWYARP